MAAKARILVIDDEEDICHFTKAVLERTGRFDVLSTTDAAQGVSLAKSEQPDLIVLDINMPFMDGGEVAQTLREFNATKDIPIIFLTALLKKEEAADQTGRIGAHTFLAKPVAPPELIATIDAALIKPS
jgi:CheY-like chemotaxis protein